MGSKPEPSRRRVLTAIVVLVPHLLLGQQYVNASHHFRMSVPDGWTQVPESILRLALQAAGTQAGHQPRSSAVVAFQQSKREPWFQYPYLVVSVDERGPMTLSDLTSRGPQVTYDSIGQTLWLHAEQPLPDGRQVSNLVATRLSSRGYVQITYSDLGREQDTARTFFHRVAKSVVFDSGYEYSPTTGLSTEVRRRGRSALSDTITFGIVGAIVALLISFFQRLRRRR